MSLRTHLVEEHARAHRPHRWPGRRPAAHPLRPLRAAQPGRTLGAASRPTPTRPGSRASPPARRSAVHRRRARRRSSSDFVRAAVARAATPASTSSTSSTATATWATSCSARATAGPRTAATRGRTRFLRRVVEGIRRDAPGLAVGVRVRRSTPCRSARTPRGVGDARGATCAAYRYAFGAARATRPPRPTSSRARAFLGELEGLGIRWICISAGSPYYNPHIQRPALFPPSRRLPAAGGSAGRLRPADRRGRARSSATSRTCGSSAPATPTSRSGCRTSARRRCARGGPISSASAGWCSRYPELPADVLAGQPLHAQPHLPHLQRLHHRAAQRPGLGLLPARSFYKAHPDAARLKAIKEGTPA